MAKYNWFTRFSIFTLFAFLASPVLFARDLSQVDLARLDTDLQGMRLHGASAITTALTNQGLLVTEVLSEDNAVTRLLAQRMTETIDDSEVDGTLREEALEFLTRFYGITTAPALHAIISHALNSTDHFIAMKAVTTASYLRARGIEVFPDYVETLAAWVERLVNQHKNLDSIFIGFFLPVFSRPNDIDVYTAQERARIISLTAPLMPRLGALITLALLAKNDPLVAPEVAKQIARRFIFDLYEDGSFSTVAYLDENSTLLELPISKDFDLKGAPHIAEALGSILSAPGATEEILNLIPLALHENENPYILDFHGRATRAVTNFFKPLLKDTLISLLNGSIATTQTELIYAIRAVAALNLTEDDVRSALSHQSDSADAAVKNYAVSLLARGRCNAFF